MTRAWSCCCSRRRRQPRKATGDRRPAPDWLYVASRSLPTSWHRAPLIWPGVCDPWEPIDRPIDRHTGGEVPYIAADRFPGRRLESAGGQNPKNSRKIEHLGSVRQCAVQTVQRRPAVLIACVRQTWIVRQQRTKPVASIAADRVMGDRRCRPA
jgi:hypothetical protein